MKLICVLIKVDPDPKGRSFPGLITSHPIEGGWCSAKTAKQDESLK
jgi:hypothetical protein